MKKKSPGKLIKALLIQVDKRTPNIVKNQFSSTRRAKMVKSIPNHWSKTLMVDIAEAYPLSLATQVAFGAPKTELNKINSVTRSHTLSSNEAVLLASDVIKGGSY